MCEADGGVETDYLVDNIYVLVGNKVFRQCIGIPMGTDCTPLLANLYLFSFEYKFMKGLLKNNISKAKFFSNTFRYIDDLLTINNPSFDNPSELILKKTTESCLVFRYWYIYITKGTVSHCKFYSIRTRLQSIHLTISEIWT